MTRWIRRIAIPGAIALSLIAGIATASAQQPIPELVLVFNLPPGETEPRANEEFEMVALLVDPAGNPIEAVEVQFLVETSFLNVTGNVRYGNATTGQDGRAVFPTALRADGENNVIARFTGNDVFAPVRVTETINVLPGPRAYVEVPPVRIPGANVWMVTAVLGAVWGLYLISMIIGLKIARAGRVA